MFTAVAVIDLIPLPYNDHYFYLQKKPGDIFAMRT